MFCVTILHINQLITIKIMKKEEYSYETKYALLEYFIENMVYQIKSGNDIRLVILPFDSSIEFLVREVNKIMNNIKNK